MSTTEAGTFCWFECASTDAVSVKPFYTGVFDWLAEDVPMPGDESGHYTMLRVGEADTAGLYSMCGPQFTNVPSHWASYVRVDSADATAGQAIELGGKVVMPAMDVPGVGRVAFVEDPTGATLGLFQAGEHRGAQPPATTHGAMGWSLLTTGDPPAAAEFYSALFGWIAQPDEQGPYVEIRHAGRSIAGILPPPAGQDHVPANWMPYVSVDDCDVCAERVTELGGRLLMPPMSIPGVGRFAVLQDPAGACLAFIQLDR